MRGWSEKGTIIGTCLHHHITQTARSGQQTVSWVGSSLKLVALHTDMIMSLNKHKQNGLKRCKYPENNDTHSWIVEASEIRLQLYLLYCIVFCSRAYGGHWPWKSCNLCVNKSKQCNLVCHFQIKAIKKALRMGKRLKIPQSEES